MYLFNDKYSYILNTQVTSSNDDAMKDEIERLKTEIDIIKAETVQLKLENDELKARVNASTLQEIEVSRGSHEPFIYTITTTHMLITN